MTQRSTKVLVVDDSAIVRKILSEALGAAPDIEVIGTAPDPFIARDKIAALQPDVITLDIEMPRMDGLSFLREIMASTNPRPVIIISSLAQRGCAVAMEALEAGAVEIFGKPNGPYSVGDLKLQIAQKVRSAACARLRSRAPAAGTRAAPAAVRMDNAAGCGSWPVIALGASTGGTEALSRVLQRFPKDCPPTVVVQHIPPVFSTAFASRLDRICSPHVKEAANGDAVCPGQILIAPGDSHMVLRRTTRGYSVKIADGPRVCYQRPSVDVLFQSTAETCGAQSVGVILTGMGSDGAAGLLKMRTAGARTLAQDEQSCVVFGMPKEAIRVGAVEQVLPLDRIADAIAVAARSAAASRPSPVS